MRSTIVAIGLAAGLVGCGVDARAPEIVDLPAQGGASATGGAGSMAMAGGGASPLACPAQAPPSAPLALLTRAQYDNVIFDLLADASKPASTFPPENEVQGFKNNTAAHQASPLLVEKYLEGAEAVASRAIASRLNQIAPCTGSDLPGCGRAFVRDFGLRVFRRPLTAVEAQLFDDLFMRSSQAGFASAVTLVLQAMLQSPQFLYRVDSARAPSPESGAVPIASYELASRLSFFLTGSMPDADLLRAAAENRLSTDAEVETQTRRLLETPRAREVVREFHRQWLGLDALPSTARDAAELGEGAKELGKDWLGSLDRFVDHVYWEEGNVLALFSSKRVYLTPRLATLYGVAPSATDYAAADLADRAGLLTQPGLLALLAHSNQSAPVLRGVFVRERLMCQTIPPPPPTVNNTPPDPDPMATTRERFRVHTEKSECAVCHQLIDGVGFGFEAYDQLGRYRTTENGLPVDASGNVLRASDASLDGPFNGVGELSARLGQSQRVWDCVAAGWYRFAFGRLETEADTCSLNEVKLGFQKSGGSLRELFVAITRSVAFRYRPAMPEAGP